MIKALIFDFGDVFINLDKEGTIKRSIDLFGKDIITEAKNNNDLAIFKVNDDYEKGFITTKEFVSFYTNISEEVDNSTAITLWNSLIKDFPTHRLAFIKKLAEENNYKLILLSNTNELHINYIKENVPFYEEFKGCFDAFYLSHEIGFRKPDTECYKFVLSENKLRPKECFFIDDTIENTLSAATLDIHTWHINPKDDDITELFTKNKHLFE